MIKIMQKMFKSSANLGGMLLVGAVSFALPQAAFANCPDRGQGGLLQYSGGPITVTEEYASAGYTSELYLLDAAGNAVDLSAITPAGTPFIMYNYNRNQSALGQPWPYSVTFNPSDYGITPGAINFGIHVLDTDLWFKMGDGISPSNPDGVAHAVITPRGNGNFGVGFEDLLWYQSDCDFDDNMFNFYGAGLTVGDPTNSPPVVSISAPVDTSIFPLGNVALTAPFTDADLADTHTCTVDWGYGAGEVAGYIAPGTRTCTSALNFSSSGVYNITVKVTDNKGGIGSEKVMIVVYDPNGGFVTGGGWINSPQGALVSNPGAFGKANFGFVSKYLKGANVPSGSTEFQFQAGSFNFHSNVQQWLVVAGCKAQYKGTGSVNQVPGYGFLLTATDGNICANKVNDKLRLKIWSLANGEIVYDNNLGSSDDLSVVNQDIAAGNIVIHK